MAAANCTASTFLPLAGLGVRDLHLDGDDLLLLAGPTMVLDGAVRVFRWVGARVAALAGVTAGEGAALVVGRCGRAYGAAAR